MIADETDVGGYQQPPMAHADAVRPDNGEHAIGGGDLLNVIVPLGGRHQSARSLLAEIMNDPELEKVVLVAYQRNGDSMVAHYQCTRAELTFAAATIERFAFDD